MNHKVGLHILFGLIFAALRGVDAQAAEWNYRLKGPAKWSSLGYGTCDSGTNQSPINIDTSSVTINRELKVVYQQGYANASTVDISFRNTGVFVLVSVESPQEFRVTAASARDNNKDAAWSLAQFHWHWGGSDVIGSEHTINSLQYSMEMHMVHYNTKYDNIQAAVTQPDGILVLAFVFDTDKSMAPDNPHFQMISDALPFVQKPGTNTTVNSFSIYRMIEGASKSPFYYYQGSLTAPGCNEVVTWIIYQTPITISANQLDAFRNIQFRGSSPAEPQEMVDTFRPVQPLNGRIVYTNNCPSPYGHWSKLTLLLLGTVLINTI